VELLFAEAKQWHGLVRFRLRTLAKVNQEALLIASVQNLKRLLGAATARPLPPAACAEAAVRPSAPIYRKSPHFRCVTHRQCIFQHAGTFQRFKPAYSYSRGLRKYSVSQASPRRHL